MWLDEITKHIMGARPTLVKLYLGIYITGTICVIPWLYLAWFGIRRESKRLMYVFLFLSVLFLAGSGGMFKSDTFRNSFAYWPFFRYEYFIYILRSFNSIKSQCHVLYFVCVDGPHYRSGGTLPT
jgi:hypothetical protein